MLNVTPSTPNAATHGPGNRSAERFPPPLTKKSRGKATLFPESLPRFRRSAYPALLGLISVFFAGCGQQPDAKPAATLAADKDKQTGPTPVALVKPERRSLVRMVEQPGAVHAFEEAQLVARLPGYVLHVRADIGQSVKTGQFLAELSVPELVEEANQKKATTRQAEAEVQQAKSAVAAAEANVLAIEAAGLEAFALKERWDSEFVRISKLFEAGSIDAQAREEVKYQAKAASARVESAAAATKRSKADRDKVVADLRVAEARVDVAKADALRTEALLGYAKITAPFDGVVTRRKVNVGDFVQPSSAKGDWLFTIARVDPVRVVVSVPENDASLVRDKAAAKLTVRGAEILNLETTVTRSSWGLDPGSRTLRVEFDLPNKAGTLRPGMYVTAQILTPCPETWTLPASAIQKLGDRKVIYLVENNKTSSTAVQTGRTDGQFVEVQKLQAANASGTWTDLHGGEQIVLHASKVTDAQVISPLSK